VCSCAILIALTGAAPANASGPLIVYPHATVQIGAHRTRSTSVHCSSRFVLGGGVSGSSGGVTITQNDRTSFGWTATAVNRTRTSQSLTVTADCIDLNRIAGGILVIATAQTTASDGGTTSATVDCGSPSARAISGGFYIHSTDARVRLERSEPASMLTGWTVGVANTSGGDVSFEQHAICLIGGQVLYGSTSRTVAANHVGALATTCSAGQIGGGGVETLTGTSSITASRAIGLGHRPPGTGWTARIKAGPSQETLTTFAECVSAS